MVLGFLAHGYATGQFPYPLSLNYAHSLRRIRSHGRTAGVSRASHHNDHSLLTLSRCYLPTEHIDNPKGYAEGEDARKYDPRLRGPVEPVELEIDLQSGMKRYIADGEASV